MEVLFMKNLWVTGNGIRFVGPDKRLYCGTIGASNIGSIKAFDINKTLETDSWSIRGGDIQGTNRQK